jgi:hypothetical protein
MKSFYIFLLSESILFPLLVGLVRLRRIKKSSYQPFFFLLILGAFIELLSAVIILLHARLHINISNAISNNIYSLLEWLFIAWQFKVWGLPRNRMRVFYIVVAIPCLVWVVEDLVFGQILNFAPYFRVVKSLMVVLFSVSIINFMITHDYRNLSRNPTFLICIAFIIYFIYRIIFQWARETSLLGKTDTTTFIIMLFGYVNALTNIIFAIALLRIPPPQKFTLK